MPTLMRMNSSSLHYIMVSTGVVKKKSTFGTQSYDMKYAGMLLKHLRVIEIRSLGPMFLRRCSHVCVII